MHASGTRTQARDVEHGVAKDERPLRHPDVCASFGDDGEMLLRGPKYRAPLHATHAQLDIIGLCDGTRTLDDLASLARERGVFGQVSAAEARALVRPIVRKLAAAGLLVGPEQSGKNEDGYARPWVHRLMLQDAPRTEGFRAAIEAVVKPGDVVLDVGTGTGILSVFAARAGAREVHAVERSALADTAAEIARASGQGNVVRVHRGDARALELRGADGELLRARVLVSEWIGHFAVTEGMFPSVATIRDRHLAEGGVLIPSRVEMLVAPIEDAELRSQGPGFWFERPWGVDMSPLGRLELSRPTTIIDCTQPEAPLSAPVSVHAIDCVNDGPDAVVFASEVEVTITRDGTLDGLCGWFTADLAPGITLDTSPSCPPTHWRQHLFPIRPVPVKKGQRLEIHLSVDDASYTGGTPTFELKLILDGKTLVDSAYAAE